MELNAENLRTLYTGFSAAYQRGFDLVKPSWQAIAMATPSATKSTEYGWLGAMPRLREWIGDRVIQNIAAHGYAIKNRRFEGTVEVDADDIEDDNVGIYAPMMEEMGRSAAIHPDELVFGLLAAGGATACYDGQPFFSANHPVGKKKVSNVQAGSKPTWYLFDTSRSVKPLIYQKRRDYRMVRKDRPEASDAVFMGNKLIYGTDGRGAVGFGFWQMAYASSADLTRDSLRAAYTAMTGQEDEAGRKLAIKPTVLVVPNTLQFAANDIVKASVNAAGATNTDFNLVDVLVSSYLPG